MTGKNINFLGSRWVLAKRNDDIVCKHDANELYHIREISQEMTKSEKKI